MCMQLRCKGACDTVDMIADNSHLFKTSKMIPEIHNLLKIFSITKKYEMHSYNIP